MVKSATLDNEYDSLSIETMISKEKILTFVFGGSVLQVILILFSYSSLFESCYNNLPCREGPLNWSDAISPYVHLFIPLFLFSLITYRMREEVYQTWFRFVRWWIPLSMLLIFLAPEYSNDWMYPIEKGSIALLTSAIFCVVSLVIIAAKYISLRKGKI